MGLLNIGLKTAEKITALKLDAKKLTDREIVWLEDLDERYKEIAKLRAKGLNSDSAIAEYQLALYGVITDEEEIAKFADTPNLQKYLPKLRAKLLPDLPVSSDKLSDAELVKHAMSLTSNPSKQLTKYQKLADLRDKGIDPTAHTTTSFARLGPAAETPISSIAHKQRGFSSYAREHGIALSAQDLATLAADKDKTLAELDSVRSELHNLQAKPSLSEKETAKLYSLHKQQDVLDEKAASFDEKLLSIPTEVLNKYIKQSAVRLDRPLYLRRAEGAFSDRVNSDTPTSHLHSAQVIEPLETLPRPTAYNPGGELPERIYKVPTGSTVYHPNGAADFDEVVVSRGTLQNAQAKRCLQQVVLQQA